MKKINIFYKKEKEEFTAILEKHIAETRYCIDRAYKTKSAGFEDLYTLDFKKLSKVSYVVTDGLDMKVADSAKEDELRKYDTFKASKDSEHYVYVAYGIDGDVLYVGKGIGDRYKHCDSGISSNYLLNRHHFNSSYNGGMIVDIVKTFDNDTDALIYEKELIFKLDPLYNKQT